MQNGFTSRFNNIDAMIDILNEEKRKNGVKTTMERVMFHPNTNERMNRFQKKIYEKNPLNQKLVNLKKEEEPSEKPISNIERGVFVYDQNDIIDEDSSLPYVCEYCTQIDYTNRYRPDICDLCDSCETCNYYTNNECDGCEYSVTFNGCTYSEATGDVGESSKDNLDMKKLREKDESIRTSCLCKNKFTIFDY